MNENGQQVKYGKDPADYLVDVLSGKAASYIDSSAAAKKPFMLEVATFAPHAPYTPAPRYATAAQGVAYPKTRAYNVLPTASPSWLESRPSLTVRQQQTITADYDKRVEADLAVDDLVANVQKELQAKNLAGDTYFIFSSDNGYHMGEYRLMPGKQTAFDTDIHVPLIVSGPAVPAGRNDSHLVSNVDIAPTLETLAGATVGTGVDGISMDGIWHGHQVSDWPAATLIEHHGPDDVKGDPDAQGKERADPPSYEAIRTADALYVKYSTGEQEYYNTTVNPDELHNVAADGIPPALPAALTALQNCHTATACVAAAHV